MTTFFVDSKIVVESKVETILKGSLDSITSPSPSEKIQIMGRKVCLRGKGKTLLGDINKLFDNDRQCFANIDAMVLPYHLK